MTRALAGLWPPVATPFREDGAVDTARIVRHCRALIADGCEGLAILGTTSEANSLSLEERRRIIDALVEGGIEADRLLPGVGACAVDDVVTLAGHAHDIGASGVLMLPPFYYKKVSDDGTFNFFARVIEKLGARAPQIMLYHIPPIAAVGFSLELVGRLVEAFPNIVVGIKDSSGDAEHTLAMIRAFPSFAVFPGAELYLVRAMKAGARGCISATANVNAAGIATLLRKWQSDEAGELQEEVNLVRRAVEARGNIPGCKAILSDRYRDPAWANVRPPLVALNEKAKLELLADPAIAKLRSAGRMPSVSS
jgi:4-hydroxy-tetrahydrodipicolinate synthase